jgi:hypothetical protein
MRECVRNDLVTGRFPKLSTKSKGAEDEENIEEVEATASEENLDAP